VIDTHMYERLNEVTMGKTIEQLVPDFATMSSSERQRIEAAMIEGGNYYGPDRVLAEGIRDLALGMVVRGTARAIREDRMTPTLDIEIPAPVVSHHDARLEGVLHAALETEHME
jgi:hypothetical protein